MIDAVKAGDAARVRSLLKTRPELLYAQDSDGTSAILIALYWGKAPVLQILLRQQPTLTIFEAAALGHMKAVHTLLSEQPSLVHAYSHDGYTPLHLAAFFGRTSTVRLLVKSGAPVNAESRNGMRVQPLGSAAAGNHVMVCKVLLAAGADVHARQEGGFTARMSAEQNGNMELAQLFT